MERYYFDANATTPPLPEVVSAEARAMAQVWANPTSTHREGQKARNLLEEARRTLAGELCTEPARIIFCSSATEALHLGSTTAWGTAPRPSSPGSTAPA